MSDEVKAGLFVVALPMPINLRHVKGSPTAHDLTTSKSTLLAVVIRALDLFTRTHLVLRTGTTTGSFRRVLVCPELCIFKQLSFQQPRREVSRMSAPASDYKKRPPPIAIPQWPPARTVPGPHASVNAPAQTQSSGQHPQRFASSSTQQAPRSGTNTPLTSPLELDESRLALPKSGSQASKHRSSAMTTLSDLMDQARRSPRKSDYGSVPSRHGSTARSRQPERSHRSAAAAQARLEALDEDETTLRSQIESRTERKLFKTTGQIPPTPTSGKRHLAVTKQLSN